MSVRPTTLPIPPVLVVLFGASLLAPALPTIALDTTFADLVVRVTDTAVWPQLAIGSVVALLLVVSRPGLERPRRRVEAWAMVGVLLVAVGGNAALNEYAVKPLFGVPRPNIESLADEGTLGTDLPTAEAFYAVGGKGERRAVLKDLLEPAASLPLSDLVRSHWIHETGYSFPSGHSTAAMTFASLLALIGISWLDGWRRAVTVFVVPAWAVAVVYTRILLQVHTGADVIVGTLAGLLWGGAAFFVMRRAVDRYALPTRDGSEGST